ncbi:MAG: peptide chain release factor 1 [Simkaniaceae bacterium]
MEEKIKKYLERLSEVENLLSQSEILADKKKYRELTQEYAYLSELKETWLQYQKNQKQLKENEEFLEQETDPEFVQAIEEENKELQSSIVSLQSKLESLLVPPDPRDSQNIIVEIRAGTGGDEAAIFVGDLVRMYRNFASKKKWMEELLSCTPSEAGGFKEYIMLLSGQNVYRLMKYEAGTHRVQRVPVTEAGGRIHTSAATVAILLEPGEEEDIQIDEKDLKIDTFRSSGAGGQHVNVTDSAVRMTHLPSGIVVSCQEERSQHKNREKALRILAAKLAEQQRQKQMEEMTSLRSQQVGTGDRSERIRTYNYPQNRVTDHRINLTLYKLDQIMEGDLDEIVQALVSHYYAQKLTA